MVEGIDMHKITTWLRTNKLGIVLFPLLCAAVCVLVEKLIAMIGSNAFCELAAGLRTPPALHFWEKVSLFRSDLFCGFVLLPVAFSLLTFWIAPRRRVFISIAAAFLIEAFITIELIAITTTNTFASLRVLWFDLMWIIRSRETAFASHPGVTALFLVAGVAIVGLLSAITLISFRRNTRWLNHAVLAAYGLGIAATAVACVPRVPVMPWSRSLLQMAAFSAFFENEMYSGLPLHSAQELMQTYRQASHVPAPHPTAFTGKAKDYNIILFVMESMSAQVSDPARDSLSDMPNLRRLRDHSFVMSRHYTSYPLTDNAAFSIFTSLYVSRQCGIVDHHVEIPGLIRSLQKEGYQTAYYGFVWSIPQRRDDLMLASLGFQKIAAAHIDPKIDQIGKATFFGPVKYVTANDRRGLLALREDIRNWTAKKQRFAAAYFPEIGHDPYRALDGQPPMPLLERGHVLAVLQDAWLGELLDELQRDGALDNTIIIFTSDHGMRWTPGDQEGQVVLITQGRLEDIELRVPMLIYVPGILQHPEIIDTPTSHIDITPTLLDLVGISAGRENEQGLPVYAPEINQRRLFLQMDMFGASGFYYGGSYYSRSSMGFTYKSATMNFEKDSILRFGSKEAEEVRNILAAQDANQDSLLSGVLDQKYFH
jgi:phosphoglycerol transferase MdoB-like AlkP superfamily enzyme